MSRTTLTPEQQKALAVNVEAFNQASFLSRPAVGIREGLEDSAKNLRETNLDIHNPRVVMALAFLGCETAQALLREGDLEAINQIAESLRPLCNDLSGSSVANLYQVFSHHTF